MSDKLLLEPYLEFLSLTRGWEGSNESTLVKMPLCWKLHFVAHMLNLIIQIEFFFSCVSDQVLYPVPCIRQSRDGGRCSIT